MKVIFTTTTKSKLATLPITNGQIIAISDAVGYYYDMAGIRYPASSIQVLDSLPTTGIVDMLYIVNNAVYTWDGIEFVKLISSIAIDDSTASTATAYSSAKTEELIDAVINDSVASTATAYSGAKVNALIQGITSFEVAIVQALPTEDISTHTIYFLEKSTPSQQNCYEEYMYIENAWELIGTTEVTISTATTATAGIVKPDGTTISVAADGTITAIDSGCVDWVSNSFLGAKNLLPYPYYDTTYTTNGITFTDNGDGSVTASGTATASTFFNLKTRSDSKAYPNGKYILSGCPSVSGVSLRATRTNGGSGETLAYDFGSGVMVTLNGDDFSNDSVQMGAILFIGSGTVISTPITFYPMLRLASDTDSTYRPYAMTNKELTDELKDKIDWASNSFLGAKNLIKYPYIQNTRVVSGVTFTDNGDGTITANGKNTSTSQIGFMITSRTIRELILPNGKYILNGCPENGSSSTYFLQSGRTYNDTFSSLGDDYGSGVEVTLNGDDYDTDTVGLQVAIIIRPGVTVSNLLFKPMLRIATDTDDTWHPYSDTNENLTANKVDWTSNNTVGPKNLIVYPYLCPTVSESRGVTFTCNRDGSVSFDGTPDNTSSAVVTLQNNQSYYLKAGSYIVSGGNDQYGGMSLYFYDNANNATGAPLVPYSGTYLGLLKDGSNNIYIYTTLNGAGPTSTNLCGYDKKFTIFQDAYVTVQVRTVNSTISQRITGTVWPMIRAANDPDSTYSMYSDSNRGLSLRKVDWRTEDILGAKNRLYYPYYETTLTRGGITFTDLGDGRVRISGTATADTAFICSNYTTSNSYNTMLMTGGLNSNCWMRARVINSDDTFNSSFDDYGDGVIIGPIPSGCKIGILIYIKSGFVASNNIIYPMIRYAADSDPNYRPYARTNRELTVDVRNAAKASGTSFVNTGTGLSATNVQGAIAELAASNDGHVIVNPSGTSMTQRNNLQFTGGVTVTDDSTNGKTVVDVPSHGGTYYAECSTGASTAAKVAAVSSDQGDFVLKKGIIVVVGFLHENTATGATLNINNTGAKNIYQLAAIGAAPVEPYVIRAYDRVTLMYSGSSYYILSTQRGSTEIWTPSVFAAVGATTITISHTAILANNVNQVVDVYARNSSETCIGITSVVTTSGQAVITLAEALTEATDFRLKITCI